MRIAGGMWRGRTLRVPKTGCVRPTQERVREAFFSMVAAELPGCAFLDLFAGSGAVGLEALSRGAARAVLVERDARHVAAMKENIAALGAEGAEAVRGDAGSFAASLRNGGGFDIAFADPPYAAAREGGFANLVQRLADSGTVRGGGLFAAECDCRGDAPEFPGWTLAKDRSYGKTRLLVYRRDRSGSESPGAAIS